MRTIGNILWFLFGGLIGGLSWVFAGCVWCITIVGIPVGLQCFKFASLAFWPFGKDIVYGNGMFSFLVNLIWLLFLDGRWHLESNFRPSVVHYNCRNSVRKTIFQNGKAISYAVWSKYSWMITELPVNI